ncbi:DUF4760 domain-containing protein [Bradyrhizobium yuanmingense]|uniref:DUF4760 domain-containing protein n=1 Tax=Bradyrhizobium yuanmingense TaxID=108015 RepID=UPI0023B896C4|nr:DUF4760 domain-containing protein [Bradyrhizobium yuanmingense]MDF0498095.1 DUF4760 domain-containing protein [Bradyrhizobium yuanmingense]
MDWGTVPQWATALVALGAAGIAIHSIAAQRDIARKRATIDFFLKSSMDKECLAAYVAFKTEIEKFKQPNFDYGSYVPTAKHNAVRVWLNICELVAVGINRKVFDDRLAFDSWAAILPWCHKQCAELIKWRRENEEECELIYFDLEILSTRWQTPSVRAKYERRAKQRGVDRSDTPLD